MKKLILALCLCTAFVAHAQPAHLVISQVYAGGGNAGAYYANDFVELYNPTGATVSLNGWSLQYAGATSTTWSSSNKASLSGSIAPGKYFLIKLDGGPEGQPLPQPDFSVTDVNLNLGSSGGKVVLVNTTTALSGSCPGSGTIDFVAYKSTTTPNCAEGTYITTPTNNTGSISRKNSGCTDADNNSTDFENTTPSPRNSFSNGHTCNGNSISVGAVTPNPFCVDATAGATGAVNYTTSGSFSGSTFKAVLSDAAGSFGYATVVGSATVSGSNPSGTISIAIPANTASGTGYRIRIEATNPPLTSSSQSPAFEIINGPKNLLPGEFSAAANNTTTTLYWTNPAGCFDEILIVAKEGSAISGTPSGDGSNYVADLDFNGNGTPFDGGKVVYKGSTSGQTVTNVVVGKTYFFKAFTRRGTQWSSGSEISDKARIVPLAREIVINQLSPDYGAASDEYIELANLTDRAFDLSDLTIKVSNESGNNGVAGGTLSGTIPAHGFWLLARKTPAVTAITVGKTVAVAVDGFIDDGISATKNQVALIRKTDNTIIDAVGFGAITNPVYTEGTSAPNPPADGGLKRVISGVDNNNNRTDFATVANADIELRNSSSRLANSGAVIAGGTYTALEVTGNASLAGNATFTDKVVLTKSLFALNNYTLTTAKVTDDAANKYVRTNGSGALAIPAVNGTALFAIGNSTYNPVTITSTENLNWRATVADTLAPARAFDRSYAVQRTWYITPSATPVSGATLQFEYDEADAAQLGSHFDKTKKVQIWTYHNGLWQPATGPQTPATTASGRKAVTLSGYTQFSPFVIVNVNAPLPVHFTAFSAQVQSGGVQLQFTNASEKDVAHYEVERSANGQVFQTLIQLQPVYNNGSTATYRWLDAAPLPGDAWYRITGVDEDGTVRRTAPLQISATHHLKTLTVYPSPVRGRTVVWQASLPKGRYALHVVSNNGQNLLRQTFDYEGGNRTQTLLLPATLPAGTYRLQISNGVFVQQQSFVVIE